MITAKCKNCSKEFKTYESRVKKGKGKYCSLECYNKAKKGRKHTEEWKIKVSKSLKGRIVSLETREKIRLKNKGHKLSKEQIEGMRKRMIGKYTGAKNPAWLGGKSFEEYTDKWTDTLKRAIRERDNYICQICGSPQDEDQLLSIHHIDYDKKNCCPENLVSLHRKCHGKTTHNRPYWIEFFNAVSTISPPRPAGR